MKKIIFLFALVFAVIMVMAQSNVADITTDGDNNQATSIQLGSNNSATIDQFANESEATQTQIGSDNVANIEQFGSWPGVDRAYNVTAVQSQTGTGHQAYIRQMPGDYAGNSSAQQLQNGANHYALIDQFAENSIVYQEQIGSARNDAEAYQTGTGNYISQFQNGQGNRARVDEQTGFGGYQNNVAIQSQVGNWNNALIEQYNVSGGKSWPGATGNTAEIYQTGDDNWAGDGYGAATEYGIRQWGNDNTAIVTQNDVANKSQVLQVGIDNTANITQGGGTGLYGAYGIYWNQSDIVQTGDGNTANVTQTYAP